MTFKTAVSYASAALLLGLVLVVSGCGGGGGSPGPGNGPRLLGRVLNVATGGPTNPQSSVQVGANSALTAAGDGSFSVVAFNGASSVTVDTLSALGAWVFNFPAISSTTDIGDLWVGPERVVVRGFVINSTSNAPVPNAFVTFAGRFDTTDANGEFILTDVAYSSVTQTAFWGIVGRVSATGFDPAEFSAQPRTALAGTVTVDDILMTPTSDPNPPGQPFNIWGRVSPSAAAPGTIVTLLESGSPVRVFNVGSDATYKFWVAPGTYTIEFQKGVQTGTVPGTVVVDTPNDIERRDITLP